MKQYQIAIVEDENIYADVLKEYLDKFSIEKNTDFSIVHFKNAVSFLENYSANYDLVFMDIQMPYLNGMDAAHRLRELDSSVLLIFMTNFAQYAISGYEVDALDYILKPINYFNFSLKMTRALNRLQANSEKFEILISTTNGKFKIPVDDIRYIETVGHHFIYHVKNTEYKQYATLSSAQDKLKTFSFARCNNCYLVNLKYVEKIKGYSVTVDGITLQISQPRKKEFVRCFTEYLERNSKPSC